MSAKLFGGDKTKAYDAAKKAQFLAFSPAFFQAVLILRDRGVLAFLNSSDCPRSEKEIAEHCKLNDYSARVLLEAGEQAGVLIYDEEKYYISKTGFILFADETARRNMNFINDVCWQGLFFLDKSIEQSKPAGLKVFGDWDTIYSGLSELPEKAKRSWFEFDHHYSDAAFDAALALIFANGRKIPSRILDVGGNTGKFALKCASFSSETKITILDHEGQLSIAEENAKNAGFGERIDGFALDLLDHSKPFPQNFDAVWMSQFLDCFSPEDIVELLKRARAALNEDGDVYIMEPFINTQKHPQARLALVGTSLYFTAMANGKSRMYHSEEMLYYAKQAGLKAVEQFDGLGEFQTVLRLKAE